jgi:hypothetical protein
MKSKRISVASLALCLCLALSQSACLFGGATATERFARDNKAFQIGLQEADKVLNALMDTGLLEPSKVVATINVLAPVNDVHHDIIEESIKYLQVNDSGREVMVITQAGKLRLEALITSLFGVTQRAVNNPGIGIPENARAQISLALAGLLPVVVRLQGLIGQLKQAKEPAPSLRALAVNPKSDVTILRTQVPSGTRAGLLALLHESESTRAALKRSQVLAEAK